MSLFRSLVRTALRRLDDGQSEREQGRGQLMLPPPRTELGFPYKATMQARPLQARPQSLHAELMQRYEAPPPMVVPPAPPHRRRKKTVTVTEEILYRRG